MTRSSGWERIEIVNRPRSPILFVMFVAASVPAFLTGYLTRGRGSYFILLSILLALSGFYLLASLAFRATGNHLPRRRRTALPRYRHKAILTTISLSMFLSAVLLESHVMSWIKGDKVVHGGLPWAASLFLVFLSSTLYVHAGGSEHVDAAFGGRPGQVFFGSASMVLIATFLAVFRVDYMSTYTSIMKMVFFLLLGASVPVLTRQKRRQ